MLLLIPKLLEKKLITLEQAEALKRKYQEKGGTDSEEDFLLIEKAVDSKTLNQVKGEIYNIDVFEEDVSLQIPGEALTLVPEESSKFYKILPLEREGNIVKIGIVDPDNLKAKEALKFLSRQHKIEFKLYLVSKRYFEDMSKQYRNLTEEVGKALTAWETEIKAEDDIELYGANEKLSTERLTEEAPIIKMVAVILRHAVEGSASDIHIEPEERQTRVRFRMDGVLYSSLFLPVQAHPSIIARIKILSNLRLDETRVPQDGRFSAKIDSRNVDFRVSTLPTKLGEKVVIRVLDSNEGLRNYEEIGLMGRNLKIIQEAAQKPYGLILVTGPTGSGKTTTLYSVLRELNQPEVNIITLEDPIEYFIDGVNQSQVREDIGYDFGQGLRHVVRQDPDIIMVGEVRDEESASLVSHAALTGHVVLSTLHTNNAIGVIARLIDMKIKPFLLPSTLNISVGQRLAHRLCPFCKEKVKPNKEIEKEIWKSISHLPESEKKQFNVPASPDQIYVYKPKGCAKCNMKGERGRVGIFEVLKMTPQLENIIIENPSENNLIEEAKRQGMISMRQDGILKALIGEVSIEEVFRISDDLCF
ncbi:MAG: type IV-A pilus assembly ATPase PilB [Minisyncoccus archaeiphilus]|uniref:GspE/PulE family protein n=1 Tax=Minisyncoccus archaeiphilus TaxID=3238481 RepID=UPI0009D0EF11|nr:MAG: Type II secretion system protein E [Parcubacteria group bacterium ADurb.Bin216]GMX59059.1 MAG: type IV-A pilus assembly ATPase PilB [Candidatus Parcubacteria bacterium]